MGQEGTVAEYAVQFQLQVYSTHQVQVSLPLLEHHWEVVVHLVEQVHHLLTRHPQHRVVHHTLYQTQVREKVPGVFLQVVQTQGLFHQRLLARLFR